MPKQSFFTKNQKSEIADVVVETLQDALFPLLEDMSSNIKGLKTDFKHLEKRIDEVEENLGNKIDQVSKRNFLITDHHADRIDDHEKRIVKVEKKPAAN
ncbi:MAG TPA: hypothetical protein VLE91_03005 [Candidatus Saccharimonadales bacterium]|nr:hypothetical protein [Candidatus Saccharimonadales bacterium]